MNSIERNVQLFLDAHRLRRLIAPAADAAPSAEDAYRIQDAVFAALWPGVRAPAWKVGGPSDKVEPTAAPIRTLHASPASIAASGCNILGIEAEIAFRLARDIPARAGSYSGAETDAAIGEALVTIELCDTRLLDWKSAPAEWKLADFQSNGALVTGSGTKDWRAIDFAKQPVELRIGGRGFSAVGAHPYGNPARLLPWLAAHCAKRSVTLRAGDVITCGSWTGIEFAAPGDEVIAAFPGIGEAKLKIA